MTQSVARWLVIVPALILALIAVPATAQQSEGNPAQLVAGTCDSLGDSMADLNPLTAAVEQQDVNATPEAGTPESAVSIQALPVLVSVTTVQLALADIVAADHAVNVRRGGDDDVSVACGNVGDLVVNNADLLFGIASMNESGLVGIGSLHDNGDGTTTVYVYLTSAAEGPEGTPVAEGSPAMEATPAG